MGCRHNGKRLPTLVLDILKSDSFKFLVKNAATVDGLWICIFYLRLMVFVGKPSSLVLLHICVRPLVARLTKKDNVRASECKTSNSEDTHAFL